jgi:hypothetical protein
MALASGLLLVAVLLYSHDVLSRLSGHQPYPSRAILPTQVPRTPTTAIATATSQQTAQTHATASDAPSPAALDISVGCGLQFLVVDPQGHRTGFDAATGQTFNEIPGASYGGDALSDEGNASDSSSGPTRINYTFSAAPHLDGAFRVTFFASSSQSCDAHFLAHDSDNSPSETDPVFTGEQTFLVQYASASGSQVRAQAVGPSAR